MFGEVKFTESLLSRDDRNEDATVKEMPFAETKRNLDLDISKLRSKIEQYIELQVPTKNQ